MDKNKIENEDSNFTIPRDDQKPREEVDLLRTALDIVIRRRWTILICTILSLIAAFVYLLKATPIYTSASRLYVEQSGPKIINEYEGVMTQSSNYLYTQSELIRSTPIVTEIVNNHKIRQFRTFTGVDNVAAYIKKNMHVNIGRNDDIIAVSFDSPYPVEAAEIVNALVQSYINYHSTRKQSTVSEVLKIIQKEKVKRDKELSDKFKKLLQFTHDNSEVSLENQGSNIVLERLTKLSTALTEAQMNTLSAKADYEAVKNMEDEPAKVKQFASASSAAGVRVFVNDTETQLKADLRSVEIELQNVRYHCAEDHPSVQAIRAKIDRLKQELNKQAKEFADSYTDVMRLRWMTAKEREDELRLSFDTQLQAARSLSIKSAEYSVLQSELRRTERLCEILDDRIKELNVTEDVGALNISILEVARPADNPSWPPRDKFMALSLVFGLFLGIGIAIFRNTLDYRFRSADEISAVLGIPILGVVPAMSDWKSNVLSGHKMLGFLKLIRTGVHKIRVAANSSGTSESESVPVQDHEMSITGSDSILANARKVRSELKYIRLCRLANMEIPGVACAVAPPSETEREPEVSIEETPVVAENNVVSEIPEIVENGRKVYLEPKSVVAEAFRTIRTAVFFGISSGEAKTILITSPAPGDGKSTVVSNFAITMALAGQKTLVLDADFRKPMQHKIFQIDRKEEGLSDLLVGTGNLDKVIRHGPVDSLDIISCGTDVPNPSEILNGRSFAGLLKYLSDYYDRIIIDSPPVGPVADSQILSALCDLTLFVLRAEKSTRRQSRHARDSLLSVGGHILGAIVNDVSQKRGRYDYYSYDDTYGGYGYYGYYCDDKKKTISEG